MVPNIPDWKQKLFKNILKLDRGSSPRPIVDFMTEDDDGVNWIKIGDTKKGELYINTTKEKITPEGAKKSRKVSRGEIIVSNSMSYGQPYILNIDGYIHDGWFVIRNYEKYFDKEFLLQLLGSELIQRQYKRLAAGGVVSNISSDLVYAVRVALPPLPEQQKIAKILSTWDKAIATTERLIATSQQQKKALMQQLLTGKKRLVNPETGMVFEGDWEEVKQGDVATFFNGRAYKQTEWEETGTPVIRLQNLTGRGSEFYYSTLELPDHQYCNTGDLLYMWSATFGPAIWHGEKAIYHYHIWKVECNASRLNKRFMYFLLDFETQKWMSQSNGMGLLHITKTTMEKQTILLPNVKEQQKIASALTAADKDIELLEAKLAHLKDEKKALMQQLLTGKRRVKVDTTEAA
ncbi:restriction endonuclease subunit S [Vibrio fluvialis]|nr:restriction endonuclease subunit S [Vibrio fluvialis]